jgi:thiol-disulfide isomerase/thioredoxin
MRLLHSRHDVGAAELPVEGSLPGFEGATGWLNSEPLTTDALRGRIVLVDFWTYTCINWLRTLGWVRAWADRYADDGLVVVGVHTPEFPFERDVDNVRRAVAEMDVRYPVALDSRYDVWRAFANNYWPAVYIADADGRIRHHHFGEGGYEECERAVQQLLRESGREVGGELVAPVLEGFEVQADWSTLQTPETYLGYEQSENFAAARGEGGAYEIPDRLGLNQWALAGDWTVGPGAVRLNGAEGRIAFRFHARDVHLVMGPAQRDEPVPFRVLLDGEPPVAAHGFDVDERGEGTLSEQRLHQLIRQQGQIESRTLELEFLSPGAEGYCLTFG